MKIKNYAVFFLIFLIMPFFFNNIDIAYAGTDDFEDVVISSNLIRNFKFDKFNNIELNGSGSVYGDKLKFEMLPKWELKKENVQLIYEYTVGDKAYLYYQVALENMLNVYTNVRLLQTTPKGLNEVETTVQVMREIKRPWWATTDAGFNTRNDYLTYKHYDFGDIRTYNSLQNLFSGDLEMTFDIDDTPVPNALTDSQGDTHTKEFAYISISSVGVEDVNKGKMSEDMPTVQGISVSEYKSPERNTHTTTAETDTVNYYIDPELTVLSEPTTIFGDAINVQTPGSSMNPTTKDGNDLWSPEEETSMTDGRIKLNIGSISPIVYEWTSRLDYTYWYFHDKEHVGWFCTYWTRDGSNPTEQSLSKPSALHVINRYTQIKIKAVFDIYACFTLVTPEGSLEDYSLGRPQEYYDDLVWTSSVEGTTEGSSSTPAGWNLFGGINNWITLIIIGIVGICVVLIVIKIVSPIIKSRIERKNLAGMPPNYGPTGYSGDPYMGRSQDDYNPPPGNSRRRLRTLRRSRRQQYYPY